MSRRVAFSCVAVMLSSCGRLRFDDQPAGSADALTDVVDAVAVPDDMVVIEPATFLMGCNTEIDSNCEPDESPGRLVTITRRYAVDRTEVTEAAYQVCIDAGACTSPEMDFDPVGRAQHPVNHVTWMQSVAYCEWRGRRLPTEAEWELAARGTDGRLYPWGNAPFSCALANGMVCVGDTVPVGSYPDGASPYGALDMAGNIWEFVADYYDATYYSSAPSSDPPGPPPVDGARVNRGAYHANDADNLRTSSRSYSSEGAYLYVGFRCALSL